MGRLNNTQVTMRLHEGMANAYDAACRRKTRGRVLQDALKFCTPDIDDHLLIRARAGTERFTFHPSIPRWLHEVTIRISQDRRAVEQDEVSLNAIYEEAVARFLFWKRDIFQLNTDHVDATGFSESQMPPGPPASEVEEIGSVFSSYAEQWRAVVPDEKLHASIRDAIARVYRTAFTPCLLVRRARIQFPNEPDLARACVKCVLRAAEDV